MTESVVLLEPGDERAKKIGRAMASQTANDILSLLKKGDFSLTEISDNMGQPMTTLKYHVENLLDAELIEVKKIKYSEKGREVKIYGVCDQVVIVSAGTKDIRKILLKYASVFGIFLLATLAAVTVSSSFFGGYPGFDDQAADGYEKYLSPKAYNDSINEYSSKGPVYPPSPEAQRIFATTNAAGATGFSDNETGSLMMESQRSDLCDYQDYDPKQTMHMAVFVFFLGGCLVLVILMGYEAVIWRREKRYWQDVKDKK